LSVEDRACERERTLESERDWGAPEVEHLPDSIANRSRILRKTSADHMAWDQAIRASPNRFGTDTKWVDAEDTPRTVVITPSFMAIHEKILRSVILDLADCGEEGLDVLRALLKESEGRA
jgi:hypothetical protein